MTTCHASCCLAAPKRTEENSGVENILKAKGFLFVASYRFAHHKECHNKTLKKKFCHDLNKTTSKTSVILTFCPLQPPADLAGSDDHHHHVLASGWYCSGNPYIPIQKLWPVVVVQPARCNTSESSLNRLQNSGSLRDLVVCFDLLKLFMQARG